MKKFSITCFAAHCSLFEKIFLSRKNIFARTNSKKDSRIPSFAQSKTFILTFIYNIVVKYLTNKL